MLFQWKENLCLIRCKPGSNSGGLSVVISDYKSPDFTVATQDCTPEYYTGDLRVQYTGQIFLGDSCGAPVQKISLGTSSTGNLNRFWTRRVWRPAIAYAPGLLRLSNLP